MEISATEAHELFGHGNKDSDRAIAERLGYKIVGEPLGPCGACREAKAKKEPIPKISKREPSSYPNELMFIDLSTIKKPQSFQEIKKLTKPIWRLMVDDFTGKAFSGFYDTKDGMVEPTCEQFNEWEKNNLPVKTIRCDNGCENILLQKRMKSKD